MYFPMKWPANCPDSNPIEHLYKVLKKEQLVKSTIWSQTCQDVSKLRRYTHNNEISSFWSSQNGKTVRTNPLYVVLTLFSTPLLIILENLNLFEKFSSNGHEYPRFLIYVLYVLQFINSLKFADDFLPVLDFQQGLIGRQTHNSLGRRPRLTP